MGEYSDEDKTTAGLIGENHNQNALMEQCVVRGGIAGPNSWASRIVGREYRPVFRGG